MPARYLKATTMDPAHRTVLRVTLPPKADPARSSCRPKNSPDAETGRDLMAGGPSCASSTFQKERPLRPRSRRVKIKRGAVGRIPGSPSKTGNFVSFSRLTLVSFEKTLTESTPEPNPVAYGTEFAAAHRDYRAERKIVRASASSRDGRAPPEIVKSHISPSIQLR